jgi:hypothetical protein
MSLRAPDKLRVRDALAQAESLYQFSVGGEQPLVISRAVFDSVRKGDAARLRNYKGRVRVSVDAREDHLRAAHQRIHVKDIARHELLHQIERGLFTKLRPRVQQLNRAPDIFRTVQLSDSHSGGVRARLDDPRGRNALHELAH